MEELVLILACFWSYFLISYAFSRLKITKIMEGVACENGLSFLNIRHLLGILIFGTGGYIFFKTFGIFTLGDFLKDPSFSLSIAFFTTVSIDLSFSDAISEKVQIPAFKVSIPEGVLYTAIRLIFLFTYEIFFRGALFLFSLQYFSLVYAIGINLFFYTLIHGFDSKKEIIGSIPFGILLCLFTYYSGSIWPAFIIHASLSLSYETVIISKSLTKIQKS